MSNKIALLLVVLVAFVACVQAQPSRSHHLVQPVQRIGDRHRYPRSSYRITSGDVVDISYVPYQVSLQFCNIHYCGGSVLNEKWILTAAHCTKVKQLSHLRVRLGSSEHASGGIVVQINRTVVHPKYDDNTSDYDFSLIELAMELTFSDVIQPVALPDHDELVEAGTMATVSGWGDARMTTESCAVLRASYVPIMNQKDCRKAYFMTTITNRMMCAGYKDGGEVACHRDSGGPLVADGKLVGVVSWSFGCAKTEFPIVYGRVTNIRNWIRCISRV